MRSIRERSCDGSSNRKAKRPNNEEFLSKKKELSKKLEHEKQITRGSLWKQKINYSQEWFGRSFKKWELWGRNWSQSKSQGSLKFRNPWVEVFLWADIRSDPFTRYDMRLPSTVEYFAVPHFSWNGNSSNWDQRTEIKFTKLKRITWKKSSEVSVKSKEKWVTGWMCFQKHKKINIF